MSDSRLLAWYLVLFAPLLAWHGWVFSQLWLWFVVPTFGLPALPVTQAIGIMLLIFLSTATVPATTPDSRYLSRSISNAVFLPLASWGFGWVLRHLPAW